MLTLVLAALGRGLAAELLEQGVPLAIIAKPCDAAAVRNLITARPGTGDLIRYLLVMACGGASRMTKNWRLLD
ncbi:MAG: hypothetical protein ACERLM_09630, partial [Acidimicrobiales bacterium]